MRDPQDPTEPRAPNERADDRELDSAAGIGPRVSAVFTAAEQAAEHILQMARAEVDDLRRAAEAELDAFRAQRRSDAEREARTILEDARSEADLIRTEANRGARTVEDAARRREQWIDEGIRLMVERAEWGRRGLQDVIERLEEFAVRPPVEWADAEPAPPPRGVSDFPAGRMAGPPTPPPAPAAAPETDVEREPEPEPEPDAPQGEHAPERRAEAHEVAEPADAETAEPRAEEEPEGPRPLSVSEQLQRRFGRPGQPAAPNGDDAAPGGGRTGEA